MVSTNGDLFGNLLGGTDVITFGYDVGTELLSLYISFDVLMMEIFGVYCLETHWDLLMVISLGMMNESNWDYCMVKFLTFYSKI